MTGDWLFGVVTIAFAIALLTGLYVAPFAYYQARRRPDMFAQPMRLSADARLLDYAFLCGGSALEWSAYRRARTRFGFIFLDTMTGQNVFAPIRAFEPGSFDTFVKLMARGGVDTSAVNES